MFARFLPVTIAFVAAVLLTPTPARAHCDSLDGPVVKAAQRALDTGDVRRALVWVTVFDEAEVQAAFDKALAVRTLGDTARELADRFFFETVVRLHRQSEGEIYTGLKPAGTVEPPLAAADKAIATGKLQDLGKLITDRAENGLHSQFEEVVATKNYNPNDVEAGRAFASAYVEFVHYAERLYDAAETMAPEHAQKPAAVHAH